MKLIAPDYYESFTCLADRCLHTCCAGWEIDVDPDALAAYDCAPGNFGRRLAANIDRITQPPHFILAEDERCPFLNRHGLCDIILELGKDALCQICADHPRFRNHFADHTEIGLGLCCEAAADLVLRQISPLRLVLLSDDGKSVSPDPDEKALLALRDELFAILRERSLSIAARLDRVLRRCGISGKSRPLSEWAALFEDLECLDASWRDRLPLLRQPEPSLPDDPSLQLPLEQLCAYLLYRHLPGALEDGRLQERAAFAVLTVRVIWTLCAATPSLEALADAARQYSAEIEYSDENLARLLDALRSGL